MIIAIDMDGTLLNSEGKVPAENVEAIKNAQRAGVKVVIATGRSYEDAMRPLQPFDLKLPKICANGADVRDEEGNVLHRQSLEEQDIQNAMNLRFHNDEEVYFEMYVQDGVYTYENAGDVMKAEADRVRSSNEKISRFELDLLAAKQSQQAGVTFLPKEQLMKKALQEDTNIFKFLFFSFDLNKLQVVKDELGKSDNVAISSSALHNVEVNHLKATKGIALRKMAEHLKVDMKHSVAIGDNRNDISMFNEAATSFGMGNGDPEVQSLCDYVTETNDNNGVAKAIEKVLKSSLKA
ncbi:Cof-type HAD-IIB family hydrolase [Priestia endophytica]|jgi:5-amino-6-(5-phospho-D-ribitylamino)uracil phosphatase|uniref:Cof-type HAD-IIB family hydrolase n=2 Tax=Priestia endophytica TaxID=135735 RepID=A0AAX1Q213_9BACI|nr:Cof-type HAD-IIB family hydrolase [Priestia endophytica]KYG31689.1 hypothetical protein AZF06_08110 [Priestia endophytica]MCM3537140.1 Cof-type HAD-IIB family hydrolase [Priestia endophytica]RAS71843.1 hypothetical protein A3864_22435 [Priestia endophytica]RAS74334.1 hypothetical protein A4U60_24385 [Priestia endophytica]RAS91968.1 hypothetical protein A3863_04170 [Priestia endophytica]